MRRFAGYQLFLLISTVLAIAVMVLVSFSLHQSHREQQQSLQQRQQFLTQQLYNQIDISTENLQLIASLLAHRPKLQELFYQGASSWRAEGGGRGGEQTAIWRQRLLESLAPQWHAVMASEPEYQLQFDLGSNITNFLRLQQPQHFGDQQLNIRHLLVDSMQQRKGLGGLETGGYGTGIRGVAPVFYAQNGELIGTLEVSASFQPLMQQLYRQLGLDVAILLKPQHVENTLQQSARQRLQQLSTCSCYLQASTDSQTDALLAQHIRQHGALEQWFNTAYLTQKGDQHFAVYSIPLYDYHASKHHKDAAIGLVLLWQDQSTQVTAMEHQHRWFQIWAVLAWIGLEILLYLSFAKITQHLGRAVHRATESMNQAQHLAHMGNWEMLKHNQRLSWSDEIYRILEFEPQKHRPSLALLYSRVHPEDLKTVQEAIENAIEYSRELQLEHRLLFDDGRIKHVRQWGLSQTDQRGRPERCIYVLQDRTRQQQLRDQQKLHEVAWIKTLENSGHGVWEWQIQHHKVRYSARWQAILGYAEEPLETDMEQLKTRIHPEDRAGFEQELQDHIDAKTPVYRHEHRIQNQQGEYLWVLDQGMVFERDMQGRPVRLLAAQINIHERHQMQRALDEEHRNLLALLENTTEAYLSMDHDDIVTYFNAAAEKLWDIQRQQVVGLSLWDTLPELASMFYKSFNKVLKTGQSLITEGQYPPLNLHLEIHLHPWKDGLWLFAEDITQRKHNEQQLEYLAAHDPLTGILNRGRFGQMLEKEQLRAERYDSGYALIMFDLDHFKGINDRFGHTVGDQILQQVVKQVQAQLRHIDSFCRWGGEEFMILLPETELKGACTIAERCRQAVLELILPDQSRVSISLGVVQRRAQEQLDPLLERIDAALYRAKQGGRNRVEICSGC